MTWIPRRLPRVRVQLYSFLLITAALVGFLLGARISGIFACQAPDDPAAEYLAYCNVTNFGDYDHGAFWHELEPSAIRAAAAAKILFLGNSRMQFALSTSELNEWFRSQGQSYFLLGFSHNETHRFISPILQRLQPDANMFIVNVDDFFTDKLTGPANDVMYGRESQNRYTQKKIWQKVHGTVCGSISRICGNEMSFIRAKTNGAWTFKGADFLKRTASDENLVHFDQSVSEEKVGLYVARARAFLADLPVHQECVVLMNTPGSAVSAGTVAAVAEALHLPLVAPQLKGLRTFDGAHLDTDSASRWSALFVEDLGPHVRRCLG